MGGGSYLSIGNLDRTSFNDMILVQRMTTSGSQSSISSADLKYSAPIAFAASL